MISATVELGHTYANDERLLPITTAASADFVYSGSFGEIGYNDTPGARQIRTIAGSVGDSVVRVALIDDVLLREQQKPRPEWTPENSGEVYAHQIDAWQRWERFIDASVGATALGANVSTENIFFERSFEGRGRQLAHQIKTMQLPEGYRTNASGSRLKIGPKSQLREIPLLGYSGVTDRTFPSCEVLDLAWLQKRLTIAPKAITILPRTENYVRQQANVATLAELIGISSDSFETIFYEPTA